MCFVLFVRKILGWGAHYIYLNLRESFREFYIWDHTKHTIS